MWTKKAGFGTIDESLCCCKVRAVFLPMHTEHEAFRLVQFSKHRGTTVKSLAVEPRLICCLVTLELWLPDMYSLVVFLLWQKTNLTIFKRNCFTLVICILITIIPAAVLNRHKNICAFLIYSIWNFLENSCIWFSCNFCHIFQTKAVFTSFTFVVDLNLLIQF